MTPEEWFRSLNDGRWWTEDSLQPRNHTGARRRSQGPLYAGLNLRLILTGLAVALVAAVVVVGAIELRGFRQDHPVAPVPVPTSTEPTQVHSPTPSPDPTSTPVAVVPTLPRTSPPTVAFAGDCSAIFSPAQIADYFQTEGSHLSEAWTGSDDLLPENAVVAHNGGLLCVWDDGTDQQNPTPGSHPTIRAVALSATVLPSLRTGLTCSSTTTSCDFVTGAAGYVLAGTIGFIESAGSTTDYRSVAQSIYASMTGDFAEAAESAGPPPPGWDQAGTDWPSSIDCDALFDEADVWSIAFDGKVQDASSTASNSWPPTSIERELQEGHGFSGCIAGDAGDSVYIGVLSGGAWLIDEASKGAESAQVTGSDEAISLETGNPEGHSRRVVAVRGTNLVEVSFSANDPRAERIAPEVLDALDPTG